MIKFNKLRKVLDTKNLCQEFICHHFNLIFYAKFPKDMEYKENINRSTKKLAEA